MRVRAAIGFLSVLFSLSGCGLGTKECSPGSYSATGFSQYDSAGVLISETRGSDARAANRVAGRLGPFLVLGARDPQGALFRIQGGRKLPREGVLVLDEGDRGLRFFVAEGKILDRREEEEAQVSSRIRYSNL